jgi:hypothetical protein
MHITTTQWAEMRTHTQVHIQTYTNFRTKITTGRMNVEHSYNYTYVIYVNKGKHLLTRHALSKERYYDQGLVSERMTSKQGYTHTHSPKITDAGKVTRRGSRPTRDDNTLATHKHTHNHQKIHIHKYLSNTYTYRGLFSDCKRDTFVLQTKAQQEQKVLEVLVSHAHAKRTSAYSIDAHVHEHLIL